MTEAEALEIAGIFAGNALTAFSFFITFTIAYLVAAYYVGNRLTPFQSKAVSGLYLVSSAAPMLALITNITVYGDAMAESKIGSAAPLSSGLVWAVGMTVLMVVGIVVSLIFMWQVRHPSSD
ncbi:MAG: hypothetical protein ABJN62_08840 [Halioglobus sp.]